MIQELFLEEIASAYRVPVGMLMGRTTILKINERDVRKFYARHNALLKGIRRRRRQIRKRIERLGHE